VPTKKVLIFGATGTLGSACRKEMEELGFDAVPVGRDLSMLETIGKIDGAIWAQGMNFTGGISETTAEAWDEIWQANFNFIVKSLGILLKNKSLQSGARLVVISSVWQELTRAEKVAYIASKAAVGGLVRGLAADLGSQDIAINAVLPGVVDSPMTVKNLSPDQIEAIALSTPGGKLVTAQEVARVAAFLVDNKSGGINGQSIIVDRGWSITRNV
jgi:3-oxoacyl-[acyl-carrier protein] reductase